MAQPSKANMAYLPAELLRLTFTYSNISAHDLKLVRQVCKSWNATATSLLFRQIRLSKLKSDWDAFLNIAAQPHLAACVRVLVWYELAESENTQLEIGICVFLFDTLYTDNLFWYLTKDDDFGNEDYFRDKLRHALELHHALDAMPGLHTIASQPMHPYYQLTEPEPASAYGSKYPFTAQLLQRDLKTGDKQRNFGFLNYLAPIIAARARIPDRKPTISRLYFEDEGMTTSLGWFSRNMHPLFWHLTNLDLCISPATEETSFDELETCLAAARNLTSLRLYFKRSCNSPDGDLNLRDLARCLSGPRIYWPQLRSLHIEDSVFSSYELGRFLRRHAGSIRHVTIYSDFAVKHCEHLRLPLRSEGATGLGLEQLIIVPISTDNTDDLHNPEDNVLDIREEELLGYINYGIPSSTLESVGKDNKILVRTHSLTYDVDEWVVATTGNHLEPQVALEGIPYNEASEEHQAPTTREDDGSENHDSIMADVAAEQASHSKRLLQAPRWVWEGGEYPCYRKARPGEEEESNETEMWYFQHRNGEVAYGDEPLEFWEDWEGSEAGDIAEAMPNGWQLRHEVDKHPGPNLPMIERSDGRLTKYRSKKDPVLKSPYGPMLPLPAHIPAEEYENWRSWLRANFRNLRYI